MQFSKLFGLEGLPGVENLDELWPSLKAQLTEKVLQDTLPDVLAVEEGLAEASDEVKAQKTAEVREELSQEFDNTLNRLAEGETLAQIKGLSAEHLEAMYVLAQHTMQTGQVEDAASVFYFLMMLDSTDSKFFTAFAACQQIQKNYEQALRIYAVAQLLDTSDPRVPQNAGVCCLHLNKLPEAEGLLNRANSICEQRLEHLSPIAIKNAAERQEYQRLLDKGQQLAKIVAIRLKSQQPNTKD